MDAVLDDIARIIAVCSGPAATGALARSSLPSCRALDADSAAPHPPLTGVRCLTGRRALTRHERVASRKAASHRAAFRTSLPTSFMHALRLGICTTAVSASASRKGAWGTGSATR